MNYLTSTKLLDDTMRNIGETVLINGLPQQAIITTAYLGEHERRHISSLERLKAGDYIEHKGQHYIIIQEVETTRFNKYRSAMELCNIKISHQLEDTKGEIIGYDPFGKPIHEVIPGEIIEIKALVQNIKTQVIDAYSWIQLQETVIAHIQDNELNREVFGLNTEMEINEKVFRVAHIGDLINGLLKITLTKV